MSSVPVAKRSGGRVLRTALSWCFGVLVVVPALLLFACGAKLPRLRQALSDPDPARRIAAMQALAEAKDTVSVPPIVELLKDTLPDIRKQAATSLGAIGDRRACQPLAEFYDHEQIEDVQDAGARALIRLGSFSVEPLVGLLSSARPVVRSGAARALGKIGTRSAVDPLMSLLRDRDPDVRMDAIFALRQIGDARGMEAIASMVQDTNPDVQSAAEQALSGQGAQEQLNQAKGLIRRLPYP
ncbi:MAG TPA: HEAT repeat domain-containing protein [bacterium]|nr:HEAT repeat domain-containing protein [bacterium]